MIYAPLSQLSTYRTIPYVDQMMTFMKTHDMRKLPVGEMEIEGRNLFLRVFRYPTSEARRVEEARFETHRHYADVHIVLAGAERIQTVPTGLLRPVTEYNEAKDIQFFTADSFISDVILNEGEFAVFFAGESHKPMCYYKDMDAPVEKFVFKILEA